jgi:hypothetical protein
VELWLGVGRTAINVSYSSVVTPVQFVGDSIQCVEELVIFELTVGTQLTWSENFNQVEKKEA